MIYIYDLPVVASFFAVVVEAFSDPSPELFPELSINQKIYFFLYTHIIMHGFCISIYVLPVVASFVAAVADDEVVDAMVVVAVLFVFSVVVTVVVVAVVFIFVVVVTVVVVAVVFILVVVVKVVVVVVVDAVVVVIVSSKKL